MKWKPSGIYRILNICHDFNFVFKLITCLLFFSPKKKKKFKQLIRRQYLLQMEVMWDDWWGQSNLRNT